MWIRFSFVLNVILLLFTGILTVTAQDQESVELHITWYNDGNEGVVLRDLLDRFETENPGITVKIDEVTYTQIVETLPDQLVAGESPDMARVTDLGGLSQYYLDLSPYVDVAYWQQSFGTTLSPMRPPGDSTGIYGILTNLTITGPFINVTLFEEAGVDLPSGNATWQDWVTASTAVAQATDTPYAIAMDRSGHRIAGPALSMGARYFGENGRVNLINDRGFRDAAQMVIDWHLNGITPQEVWVGAEGSYAAAIDQFVNGELVMYMSGSWQINTLSERVGDSFDWRVVPNPCGPGGCTGMPGGAALVAFADTDHPEEVARVMDFFARKDVYAEFSARTLFIPAHAGVAAEGVDFRTNDTQARGAIQAFTAQVLRISPIASALHAYPQNFVIWVETPNYIEKVIVGQITLDEAILQLQADIDKAVAETAP